MLIQNRNQSPYILIPPEVVLGDIRWFCLMEKSNLLWGRRISRRKLSIQPVISLSMWISSPIRHYDTDRLSEDDIFLNIFFHDMQNVFHVNVNIFLNQIFLYLLSFHLFYHSLISSSISYRASVYICHFSLRFCLFVSFNFVFSCLVLFLGMLSFWFCLL